ncbi:FadR/GntR family transcriptional regulator [Agromyces atrinae]|uniref:FadR family transcriptional regulator n=1 Tax=Agromyces atrinae TaxID=592376 RepID=A0A4Q2M983_9MICO|nr:FadR/GntR family transcriptional regulator [Agromyces atrinae]NYD68268.1 DNA-binding FadR family transcriptional regulator [Agromyces atrinae]RXZ85670.1 FadR family transcriptional regulator [Agromyces atrinae]
MSDPALQPSSRGIFSGTARDPIGRLGVAVVHDLITAIVTGEIAEKATLPIEAELSAHFGVSRTVIRESMRSLEEKGLISVVRGSGTTVRPRDAWNVLDPVVLEVLLENDASLGVLDDLAIVRSALEGAMAAATANRRTADEIAELDRTIQKMAESINDVDEFGDADMKFHIAVMSFSHIPLAESITKTLYSRARESARFTRNGTREAFSEAYEEHRLVLESIRQGDAAGAEAAMRQHIMGSWQRRRPPTTREP